MTHALLLLVPIVTLAFIVEAAAGFGATVVTVTLASHLLPIEQVLAIFVPVNVLLSLVLTVRNRAHVDVDVLRRHVAAVMLPAMGVGMALFALHDQLWIRAVFAGFVVLLAARELWRMRADEPADATPVPGVRRIVVLVAAGLIHGLFASGGPLLVYVVGRELPDKARFRATLSAVWLGLNSVLLGRYAFAGTLTTATLGASAALLPPLAVGLLLGDRIHRSVDARRFRLGVFSLLLFAGLSLLARSI